MDQLIFASLSHTHYWYEVGMLKVPTVDLVEYVPERDLFRVVPSQDWNKFKNLPLFVEAPNKDVEFGTIMCAHIDHIIGVRVFCVRDVLDASLLKEV